MFKWLIRDWWLKLLAFLGAITIWVFSAIEREEVKIMKLPIVIKNIPPGLAIAEKDADSVEIELKGKVKHFIGFLSSHPKIVVDLSEAKKGKNTIALNPTRFPVPSILQIRRAKPSVINITLEKLHHQKAGVSVPIEGFPKKGYTFSGVEYKRWVDVYGPRKLIKDLNQLFTDPVSLEGKSKSFTVEIPINIPDTLKGYVKLNPDSVRVRIIIEPESTVVFRGLPVNIKSPYSSAYLLTKNADVKITGPISKIKKLRKDEVVITVRVGKLKKGHYRLPAEITVPPGLQVVSEPSLFDVVVR